MTQTENARQKGRTASSEELREALGKVPPPYMEGALSNPEIDEGHIFLMLKNPALTRPLIEDIFREHRWIKIYKVKVAVVNHPNAPRHLSLNLLKFLFWRDLLTVSDNRRLNSPLRRSAEELLKERLQEMAVGEQISLARTAGRAIIKTLRESRNARIIEALLRNWRTVEEDVISIAKNGKTSSDILSIIARDYKWGSSRQVKMALLMNRRTPVHDSLKSLEGLARKEMLALKSNPKLREILKVAVSRILESGK